MIIDSTTSLSSHKSACLIHLWKSIKCLLSRFKESCNQQYKVVCGLCSDSRSHVWKRRTGVLSDISSHGIGFPSDWRAQIRLQNLIYCPKRQCSLTANYSCTFFTSDMLQCCYSAACRLHTIYCDILLLL